MCTYLLFMRYYAKKKDRNRVKCLLFAPNWKMKLLICRQEFRFYLCCILFQTYNIKWKQLFFCNHSYTANLICRWCNWLLKFDIDALIYTCNFTGPHSNAHKNHVNNERNMLERFGYVFDSCSYIFYIKLQCSYDAIVL